MVSGEIYYPAYYVFEYDVGKQFVWMCFSGDI